MNAIYFILRKETLWALSLGLILLLMSCTSFQARTERLECPQGAGWHEYGHPTNKELKRYQCKNPFIEVNCRLRTVRIADGEISCTGEDDLEYALTNTFE
jgi:hypothetical protein